MEARMGLMTEYARDIPPRLRPASKPRSHGDAQCLIRFKMDDRTKLWKHNGHLLAG